MINDHLRAKCGGRGGEGYYVTTSEKVLRGGGVNFVTSPEAINCLVIQN